MHRLLLALVLLTAGCTPSATHSFSLPIAGGVPARPSTLALTPPDSAGILVLPVIGAPAPEASELAVAMATALQKADVPASTESRNVESYSLRGTAREKPLADGRSTLTVSWQLLNAAGAPVGVRSASVDALAAQWRQGDRWLADNLAQGAAPAIASLIEGDAPMPQAGIDPVVRVAGVSGAPGDGGTALAAAIGNALQRSDLDVATRPADKAGFLLTCRVVMSPAAAGKQQVKISWIVKRPDGGVIGQVDQANAVPAGSLDGHWGDVAFAVAGAAAPGIKALVQRANRATAAGG